jgi:hypothetical protein
MQTKEVRGDSLCVRELSGGGAFYVLGRKEGMF